jgi:hypothetical protein
MNQEQRRKLLEEYVTNNPGCNKQQIIENLEKHISRVTVLKTIKELLNDGVLSINKAKPNSRDHKVLINSDSILVSVSKELVNFNKFFSALLDKAKKLCKHLHSDGIEDVYSQMIILFYELVDVYVRRTLLNWPSKIKDVTVLNKLYVMVFSELVKIQLEIIKKFRSFDIYSRNIEKTMQGIFPATSVLSFDDGAKTFLDEFKKINMVKEAKPVLDYLIRIRNDLAIQ